MKKKVIALCGAALVLIIAAALILPGAKEEESTTAQDTVLSTEETTEITGPDIVNGTKDPDRLVKITMPLSYFDAENQCDTEGFFKKGSYEKLKINENEKTFTVTIKSLNHDFMLSNVGLQVIKNLAALIDDNKKYPYLEGLGNYNSDFSQIELLVDAKEYKAADDTDELLGFAGGCGIFYQLYTTENEYHCTVSVKSAKSGKLLDEKSFDGSNSSLS